MRCISHAQDTEPATNYDKMNLAKNAYFVKPDYFAIENGINPHMFDSNGKLKQVDQTIAQSQWDKLVKTYKELGIKTHIFEGKENLPDMVFCANQTLPCQDIDDKTTGFLLSRMLDKRRHLEVDAIKTSLEQRGYKRFASLAEGNFEGAGDAIWVPKRRLLCGGYGHRTTRGVYDLVTQIAETPIALFELPDPKFYHLDTCLSILDDRSVLACREGFTSEGWDLLNALFPQVLRVPLEEADAPGFACNAHCPDTKHVIIQEGNLKTNHLLKDTGFEVVEVDTSEFIKSGGSVFCMKMMFF